MQHCLQGTAGHWGCHLGPVPKNWKFQLMANIYFLLPEQMFLGWECFHWEETKVMVCVKIMVCFLTGCQKKGNKIEKLNF